MNRATEEHSLEEVGTLKFNASALRCRALPFTLKASAHRLGLKILIFEHDKGWFSDQCFMKLEGPYGQLLKYKNWLERESI